MNFIKFGKSGPNLQQVQFEKFELKTSGSSWILVEVSKDQEGKLVWGKNQNRNGSSFVNLQELEQKAEIVLIRNKWENFYGEIQLAGFGVNHDPKMRKGL